MAKQPGENTKQAPDFSYLKTFAERTTAEYPLYEYEGLLDPLPVLIVNCVADNVDYLSEIKKHRSEVSKKVDVLRRKNRRLQASDITQDLLSPIERRCFPGSVVSGWRHVLDSNKKEVKFTVDGCRAFLQSITDSEWEGLRVFCYDTRNFRTAEGTDEDTEATAKN